jgi:hypothetical protein
MAPKYVVLQLAPTGDLLTKSNAETQRFVIAKKSDHESLERSIKNAYHVSDRDTLQIRVCDDVVTTADIVSACKEYMETEEVSWLDILEDKTTKKFVADAQVIPSLYDWMCVTSQSFHTLWLKCRSWLWEVAPRLPIQILPLIQKPV